MGRTYGNFVKYPRTPHVSTVTMLSGVPGSGKDTWLRTYGYQIVSLDTLRDEMGVDPTENQGRIAQAAKEQCRTYLRAGKNFAFNATNILGLTRRRWLDLFMEYGARVEVVYLEAPLSEILIRRKDKIPEGILYKAEPPTWREAHKIFLLGT